MAQDIRCETKAYGFPSDFMLLVLFHMCALTSEASLERGCDLNFQGIFWRRIWSSVGESGFESRSLDQQLVSTCCRGKGSPIETAEMYETRSCTKLKLEKNIGHRAG